MKFNLTILYSLIACALMIALVAHPSWEIAAAFVSVVAAAAIANLGEVKASDAILEKIRVLEDSHKSLEAKNTEFDNRIKGLAIGKAMGGR